MTTPNAAALAFAGLFPTDEYIEQCITLGRDLATWNAIHSGTAVAARFEVKDGDVSCRLLVGHSGLEEYKDFTPGHGPATFAEMKQALAALFAAHAAKKETCAHRAGVAIQLIKDCGGAFVNVRPHTGRQLYDASFQNLTEDAVKGLVKTYLESRP